MAAQKSSFFLLTPASSTTSLHEISICQKNHHSNKKKLNESSTTTTSTTASADTTINASLVSSHDEAETRTTNDVENQQQQPLPVVQTLPTENLAKPKKRPTIMPRRKTIGRGGGSSTTTTTTTTKKHTTTNNSNENNNTGNNQPLEKYLTSKQAKFTTSVNSTKSCSNLQKSKVLTNVASEEFPKTPQTGTCLSQFYLRYAKTATKSISSSHHEPIPMPELTWASNHAVWLTMKSKEDTYVRTSGCLKRHESTKNNIFDFFK